jgi:signal peptidase II
METSLVPRPGYRNGLRWLVLLCILLAGCRADLATKSWAQSEFRDKPALTLLPKVLEFRYAENRAIAFSIFQGMPESRRKPLILGLTGLGLAALLTLVFRLRKQGLIRLLPVALILGGALGNLQDRLTHGYVVDFVHVHWNGAWSFPIFNLADSLITVGMALMMLTSLYNPPETGRERIR